ncbi:MAG TPA: hypothetical protein VFB96_25640 [Pirellulaceae bacterium]|nr:hypothetical protein [Pirellulaceae bacterium]
MWCAECQLDVPALAVPEEPGVMRCAFCRCVLSGRQEPGGRSEESGVRGQGSEVRGPESGVKGQEFAISSPEPGTTTEESEDRDAVTVEARPHLFIAPPPVDEWEAESELRRVERLIAVLRQSHERDAGEMPSAECRMQSDQNANSAFCTRPSALKQPANSPSAERAGLGVWACLTLGLMAFVCGGVLVIWSFAADRADLWSLGLPLTLAGQVGLVLGLLLQLDGVSQSSRRTEATLTELDSQLDQLRGVTALVSSSHSGPAHSFYAHLTEGASPQILLADLKGQLDLLAQQMARQHKAA